VERQLAAQPRPAIEAPQQHLHVHGVTLADVITARERDEQAIRAAQDRPALEAGPPS